ncbi:hypothetical protein A2U01_0071404, partial [Trifolium medium]|nr:hypothetical protein [Trifolium medium]
ELPSSSE